VFKNFEIVIKKIPVKNKETHEAPTMYFFIAHTRDGQLVAQVPFLSGPCYILNYFIKTYKMLGFFGILVYLSCKIIKIDKMFIVKRIIMNAYVVLNYYSI